MQTCKGVVDIRPADVSMAFSQDTSKGQSNRGEVCGFVVLGARYLGFIGAGLPQSL